VGFHSATQRPNGRGNHHVCFDGGPLNYSDLLHQLPHGPILTLRGQTADGTIAFAHGSARDADCGDPIERGRLLRCGHRANYGPLNVVVPLGATYADSLVFTSISVRGGRLLISLPWWYRINRELRDLDHAYGSRQRPAARVALFESRRQIVSRADDVVKQSVHACQSSLHLDNHTRA
jgi:hypothetical protein